MIAATKSCQVAATRRLQAQFLALLPKLQTHAQIIFRDIACPDKKADLICETTALAWKWYLRLAARGKDVMQFPMVFIYLVGRAVRSGRRLCGHERAKDVLSPVAQRCHHFKAESLSPSTPTALDDLYSQPYAQEMQDAFEERLRDNLQTPVPDQVAFRLDWPRFLRTLTQRDRDLVGHLSLGNSGKWVAARFGLTEGRVSQLRQRWCREWRLFQGDEEAYRTAPGQEQHQAKLTPVC